MVEPPSGMVEPPRPAAHAVAVPVVGIFQSEDGVVVDEFQLAAPAQIRRRAQRDMGRGIERAVAGFCDVRDAPAVLGGDGEGAFRRHAGKRHGLQPMAVDRVAAAIFAEQRQHHAEPVRLALLVQRRRALAGAAVMAGGTGARVEQRAQPVIGARRARRRHPGPLEQRLADGGVEAGVVGGGDAKRAASRRPAPRIPGRSACAPGGGGGGPGGSPPSPPLSPLGGGGVFVSPRAAHHTTRNQPIIPVSICSRMWQWNTQSPGAATKAISTASPGCTSTVSA